MGFSSLLPRVHRDLPVIVRPDLFYYIRCARYLMIHLVYYINKIGQSVITGHFMTLCQSGLGDLVGSKTPRG